MLLLGFKSFNIGTDTALRYWLVCDISLHISFSVLKAPTHSGIRTAHVRDVLNHLSHRTLNLLRERLWWKG